MKNLTKTTIGPEYDQYLTEMTRPPAGSPERKKSSRIASLLLDIWDLDPKSPTHKEEVYKLLYKNPELKEVTLEDLKEEEKRLRAEAKK